MDDLLAPVHQFLHCETPDEWVAMARDPAAVLMPENPEARAFQEAVGYADAVIAGDTIYLSGVVAGPAAGEG